MMSEIIEKIDQVLFKLGGLDARFDSVEQKVDTIEDEIRCLRSDASKNSERIIRLEENYKNLVKDLDRADTRLSAELKRVEKSNSEDLKLIKLNIDDRVDKKLMALKLAIYTSVTAVIFSITQFVLGIWGILK